MKKTQILEGVMRMRFENVYDRFQKNNLSCEEAAELLGISVRTFHRKRQRYEEPGFEGFFDKRIGQVSPRRALDTEIKEVLDLYENHYQGFNVKHFHRFLKKEHKSTRCYNWTKNILQTAGLVKKQKSSGKHRMHRERRPMEGMMLHQDGSTHRWLLSKEQNFDLIVTMDDATSHLTSIFLVEEEGTMSSLQGIYETIMSKGLFCSFYTDRGSHYFYTPEAGGKVDKGRLTQVGRALKQLGIQHIAAYSPQARGRSERNFGTLQNRLPKEFKLYGIETLEGANNYLKEKFLCEYNEEFGVKAASNESAYTPYSGSFSLKDILCIQEKRIVQRDNTVHYNGLKLQIPANDYRHHYIKAEVEIHEYPEGDIGLFYGHLCLGRYSKEGKLLDTLDEKKVA